MADIIKDSYNEENRFTKVVFQRARDVVDFELNELQDDTRVSSYRNAKFIAQFSGNAVRGNVPEAPSQFNPAAAGDLWRVRPQAVPNGSVFVQQGAILCDGLTVILFADETVVVPNTVGARVDLVYVAVTEVEVPDPNSVPQLGPTTVRRQLQPTIILLVGSTVLPTNTAEEIWQGGTHYYPLALIDRGALATTVVAENIVDLRVFAPGEMLQQLSTTWRAPAGLPATFDTKVLGNYEVTVGDGVNSFGDFDGANAIRKAIDFIQAVFPTVAGTAIRINVKAGQYAVTGASDQIAVSSGSLTLVGTGLTGASITNSSTLPAIKVSNGLLFLEKLFLTNDGVDANKFGIETLSSLVSLRDVLLTSQNIRLLGGTSLLAERVLVSIGGAQASSCVEFHADGPSTGNYVFNDCTFQPSRDRTAFLFGRYSAAGANNNTLAGISFNRCLIALRGGTVVLSSLNNAGVMAIDFTNVASSASLFIRDISFNDCQVLANTEGQNNSTLMFFKNSFSPGIEVAWDSITIKGGRWVVNPNVDSQNPPFYIGPRTFADGTTAQKLGRVTVRDVAVGWDTPDIDLTAPGGPFPNVYATTMPAGVTALPLAQWAAFVINAKTILIDNVQLVHPSGKSNCGDFIFFTNLGVTSPAFHEPSYGITIRGLSTLFDPAFGPGTGTTPQSRVSFGDDFVSFLHRIEKVEWHGGFIEAVVATKGVITAGVGLGAGLVGQIDFVDCTAESFNLVVVQHGFNVLSGITGAIYYKGCEGFANSGSGFFYQHDGLVGDLPVSLLSYDHCRASLNAVDGITVLGAPPPAVNPVLIKFIANENIVEANTRHGILYTPGTWYTAGVQQHTGILTKNKASLSGSAVGIRIGQATATGDAGEVGVICKDNVLDSGAGTLSIKVTAPGGALNVSPIGANNSRDGLWTGVLSVGPLVVSRVTGAEMQQNIAKLLTP